MRWVMCIREAQLKDGVGKIHLSKGYWNPKRKLEVTIYFSKIMKQQ